MIAVQQRSLVVPSSRPSRAAEHGDEVARPRSTQRSSASPVTGTRQVGTELGRADQVGRCGVDRRPRCALVAGDRARVLGHSGAGEPATPRRVSAAARRARTDSRRFCVRQPRPASRRPRSPTTSSTRALGTSRAEQRPCVLDVPSSASSSTFLGHLTQPKDIRNAACRNDASCRAPRRQPSGPSASKSQCARHGSGLRRALQGRRALLAAAVVELGLPGAALERQPRRGPRDVAERGRSRPAGGRCEADHSVVESGPRCDGLEREVAQALRDRPQLAAAGHRGGGVDPDVGDRDPARRARRTSIGPGDQQLGVGERAALLVGDERRAVDPGRAELVDVRCLSLNSESHSDPTMCQARRGRRPVS